MVTIQTQTILLERGVWGSSPRKILLELVQNPAILDNSGGYTSLLLPYSGKFSLGSYFRDFADCIRSRENKNRNNLSDHLIQGLFI